MGAASPVFAESAAPGGPLDDLERELAQAIVTSLDLPDVDVDGLGPDTSLYGQGLGLDSIDILEVALVVSKRYGFELHSDDPDNEKIFRSIGSLAELVRRRRTR